MRAAAPGAGGHDATASEAMAPGPEPKAAGDGEDPGPRTPDAASRRFGEGALLFAATAGVLVSISMTDRPWSASANLGVLALGAGFTGLLLGLGGRIEREPAPGLAAAYFVLQLGLLGAISTLLWRQGSFGMAWILTMPLLVQGRTALGRGALAALTAACLALVAAHAGLYGGPRVALEAVLGIGTAMAFVLLFSDAALRERKARAESERLSDELAAANRQLRDLLEASEQLAAARERQRVARDIHDSLGHYLTVLRVQAESAAVLVADDPEEARRRLHRVADLAREALGEVRRAVSTLREERSRSADLVATLEALCAGWSDPGPTVELRVEGPVRPVDPDAGEALYRVAQEGLTNVRRHAGARRVELTLDFGSPDRVLLRLDDDGSGAGVARAGFGLAGLRERLEQRSGDLEAGPRPGGGFRLLARVPTAGETP